MTPEQRKIKRLESQVATLKRELATTKYEREVQERIIEAERNWRINFQSLMKAAALSNDLDEYDRS